MANSIKAVTTIKARKRFAQAHAGEGALPKITHIGLGTGGVSENGEVIMPSPSDITLKGEFVKKKIEQVELKDGGLTVSYSVGVRSSEDNVLNKPWSSLGLYDESGELVAIKHFSVKNIDEDTKIGITWNEKF